MLAAQLRSSDTDEAGPNGSVAPAPLSIASASAPSTMLPI